MSGILRNTLRLVGTAKYATNYSAKYLSTTTTNNRSNNGLSIPGSSYMSHEGWSIIEDKKPTIISKYIKSPIYKIISKFAKKEGAILSSKVGTFIASLSSGEIELITNESKTRSFIFPAEFKTKLNELLTEHISDEIPVGEKGPISFEIGELNVSLDGGKLKLKMNDRDETFILNHAVHVEAHRKPSERLVDDNAKDLQRIIIDDIATFPAELKLKSPKDIKEKNRFFDVDMRIPSSGDYNNFGIVRFPEDDLIKTADDPGKVEIEYPMNIHLQGYKQMIAGEATKEIYTVYHTLDIQVFKEETEKLNDEIASQQKEDERPKIGPFELRLVSGRLLLHTLNPANDMLLIKHEIYMRFDLDGEVPILFLYPFIKMKNHIDIDPYATRK